MDFDDLTILGDFSGYDILEKEKGNISNNSEAWVKTKKEIWRRILMLMPYSHK